MNIFDLLSMNRQKPDPTRGTGHVFNPYGKNTAPRPRQSGNWMDKPALGGSMSRGDLLLASMGMLSGRNFQEGMGNAAQYMAYGMDKASERQKEAAQKAAMQKALSGMDLTPEQRALAGVNPTGVLGAVTERAFAAPAGPLEINGQLVDPKTYDVLGDYRTPTTPKAPASGMVQDENGNWVYSPEYLAGQKEMRAAGRAQTNITMPGASQIGTIPQGYAVREDPNEPSGYRMYPIPGSKPGSEAEGAATAKAAMNNTFSAMLDGYLQLNQTGGVRNSEKGVADNFAAYVKTTPLGREYGKMTGAPDEAVRETIEALQPGIVQAIMSQPGMSARSMDSERELAFFIKSITSPTADFYANLSTLHALDMRFGSGQLIQQALQRGDITESDYEKITRSPVVNATSAMVDQKISELFTFDGQMPTAGQIGSAGPMGNSTTPMDLQGLLAADGTQVTEDDIQATMAKHGMTREEVIARIRGQ